MKLRRGWFAPIVVLLLAAAVRAEPADDGAALLRDSVANVFQRRCVGCHGQREPKGGLSLVSSAGLAGGGESGAAIVAGKPDESLLVELISGDKPAMPKDGPPLSADEAASVRRWIELGAGWPAGLVLKAERGRWWSLEPLAQPEVPAIESAWIRTPIDAFVLAKLTANNLRPAAEADRRTLLRRLTFDLHGLPPTPEEVADYLRDERPDAYERVVDRLLASPRYGERWGRYWLDVVHYGESHGYDKDKPRTNAWPYRDWVINALNNDMPYPRFVQAQLAGDVLFPDDPQATVATGFVAAGPWDFVGHVELREGTVDKAIARSNDRDDMVMTSMSTFLSLTVHCARCHDHKFDPIAQEDYYRLQAVFAGIDRGDRAYNDPAIEQRRAALAQQHAAASEALAKLEKQKAAITSPELTELDARIAALDAALQKLPDPATAAANAVASPTNGYHSAIAAKADATKWVQVDLGASRAIDAIRLVPARPTDFADTPGFGFPVRFKVSVSDNPAMSDAQVVRDETLHDFANPGDRAVTIYPERAVARYVRVTAEKLWPRTGDFVFALAELQVETDGANVALGAKVDSLDSIEGGRWGAQNLVDGFNSRQQLLTVDAPGAAAALREQSRVARELAALRTQWARLLDRLVPAELREQGAELSATLVKNEQESKELTEPLVYALKPVAPRAINLLLRGDVKSPGPAVAPGGLGCLPGLPADFAITDSADEGSRRAALARWIVDPANALALRSITNRVWHYHFGAGLVDTPNDFGRMGSLPSHPELLEWLAGEFQRQGQSLKKLHRLIVTSSVYRQSSSGDPAFAQIDSGNRLLWRFNRRRLDAEAIRDAVLQVSGKLDLTMGGPSVRQFYFKDDHSPIYDYARFDVDDPAANRRSVYRFIVRSVPDPLMECMDCADPSILTPKRETTLTALQALAMLNNRLIVRQAENFANRARNLSNDPRGQLIAAFQLALARDPRDDEAQLLLDYAQRHGLANACRVILNSNEFVFVD